MTLEKSLKWHHTFVNPVIATMTSGRNTMSTLLLAAPAALVAGFSFYQCCVLARRRDFDYPF